MARSKAKFGPRVAEPAGEDARDGILLRLVFNINTQIEQKGSPLSTRSVRLISNLCAV